MLYGNKIKEIRNFLGESQKDFCIKLGIPVMTLSRIENGEREIKIELLSKLDSLGINIEWLITGKGEMFRVEQNNSNNITVPITDEKNTFSVPILDVQAAAGSGVVNNTEMIIGTFEIGEEFKSCWGRDTGIIKISGDSMEPTLKKGSWVLVHRLDQLRHEGIFIFLHDNELRCKRIQKDSLGGIFLLSDNPKYKEEYFSKETSQLGELILLGEVVGVLDRI